MTSFLFITLAFHTLVGPGTPVESAMAKKPRREFRYQKVNAGKATYSHDGRLVLVSNNKARVGVFHGRTALMVNEFKGHRQPVAALAAWPDRDTAVSADANGELLFWRVRTAQPVGRAQVSGKVLGLFPQPGSSTVAVLTNTAVWLVDVATGRKLSLANWTPGRVPSSVAFNPAGTQLAIGYVDGGLLIRNFLTKQSVAASPFKTPVRAIAFQRDSLLAVAGTPELFLSRASSPGSGKVVPVSKAVWAVAQPDGTGIVLGTLGGDVLLFDPKKGTETLLGTSTSPVRELVTNPRERLVLATYQQTAPKSWLLGE